MAMRIHTLVVRGTDIRPTDYRDCVVAGGRGSDAVRIDLADAETRDLWDCLDLTIVFRGSGRTVGVAWDGTSDVVVPPDCVGLPGGELEVSISGTDASGVTAARTGRMGRPLPIVPAGPTPHRHRPTPPPPPRDKHDRRPCDKGGLTERDFDDIFDKYTLTDRDLDDIFGAPATCGDGLSDSDFDDVFEGR